MLLGRAFLRERPWQHEFGLEHRPGSLHHPIDRRRHPALHRMKHLPLHFDDDLAGIALVPMAVEVLRYGPELDNKVGGKVLRLDFASFFPPEPHEGHLIVAHDYPGVGAANEIATIWLQDLLLCTH